MPREVPEETPVVLDPAEILLIFGLATPRCGRDLPAFLPIDETTERAVRSELTGMVFQLNPKPV